MKKEISVLLALILTSFISGCNGSSSDDASTPITQIESPTQLVAESISKIVAYDANGQELSDANISIKPVAVTAPLYTAVSSTPSVSISLDKGLYTVTIIIGNTTSIVELYIPENNYQSIASLVIPVSYDSVNNTYTEMNASIVGSISGMVYDSLNKPIKNAQISIAAGSATNGAYATAFSDENGYYKLLINTSISLQDALKNSIITVSASDYVSSSTSFEMLKNKNSTGNNFTLATATTSTTQVIKKFDFEAATDEWTITSLSGSNTNTTWNVYSANDTGINKAYTNKNVVLAPNDISEGKLPSPANGNQCFWYGNSDTTDLAYGSFIGSADLTELSGGQSDSTYNAELISPSIDLTNITGPVKLGFKTWWEIESVNPNSNGFDLMTIAISTDEGVTWKNIARLNPLSDPETTLQKESIPFSNTGFNSAPQWIEQEAISLIDDSNQSVAGKTIKIKFTFNTVDDLFNGFRGWMIDDVTIQKGEGTFPTFDESFNSLDTASKAPSLHTKHR